MGAFEPVPPQIPFVLHVINRRLNGTASVNGFLDRWSDAAIAFVDKHRLGFPCGDLLETPGLDKFALAGGRDGFGQQLLVNRFLLKATTSANAIALSL